MQCTLWSVRGSKTPREDDLQREQWLNVSKSHTGLSIHKDFLKIYDLVKPSWNLIGMDEHIHFKKAILPWSPKSNLLLLGYIIPTFVYGKDGEMCLTSVEQSIHPLF